MRGFVLSGRGTQVVRERSAKPLCVGSIPTRASKSSRRLFRQIHVLFTRCNEARTPGQPAIRSNQLFNSIDHGSCYFCRSEPCSFSSPHGQCDSLRIAVRYQRWRMSHGLFHMEENAWVCDLRMATDATF